MADHDERERLHGLHLALEGSLEQLLHGLEQATRGSQLGAAVPSEAAALERVIAEVTELRNQVRDRLMKMLARPSLNVLK